jgi:hypothetical protein
MILRTLLILSVVCSNFLSRGQRLANTEWTRIKSERKDGSRIIDRSNTVKARLVHFPVTYSFSDNTVNISYDGEYSSKYELKGDTVFIGSNYNDRFIGEIFTIDTLTNFFLILSHISLRNLTDDKLNRFYFIKRKSYFDYLKNENKVHFINDSTIACNKLLFPYYNETNIDLHLTNQLSPRNIKTTSVFGQLLFNPNGNLERITIDDAGELTEKQSLKLKEALMSTNGSWTLPQTNKAFYFNMHFTCRYRNDGIASNVSIAYNTNDSSGYHLPPLTPEQITQVNRFYEKGIKYLKNEKYKEATIEFMKCIEIDAYNVDSIYNLGYAYHKLNENEKSCLFWKKLKDLEQVQGNLLYLENCN